MNSLAVQLLMDNRNQHGHNWAVEICRKPPRHRAGAHDLRLYTWYRGQPARPSCTYACQHYTAAPTSLQLHHELARELQARCRPGVPPSLTVRLIPSRIVEYEDPVSYKMRSTICPAPRIPHLSRLSRSPHSFRHSPSGTRT